MWRLTPIRNQALFLPLKQAHSGWQQHFYSRKTLNSQLIWQFKEQLILLQLMITNLSDVQWFFWLYWVLQDLFPNYLILFLPKCFLVTFMVHWMVHIQIQWNNLLIDNLKIYESFFWRISEMTFFSKDFSEESLHHEDWLSS